MARYEKLFQKVRSKLIIVIHIFIASGCRYDDRLYQEGQEWLVPYENDYEALTGLMMRCFRAQLAVFENHVAGELVILITYHFIYLSACMTTENKTIALNDFGTVRNRIVQCLQKSDGSYHLLLVDDSGNELIQFKLFILQKYKLKKRI
jgi:hypothetical protein